MSIDPKDLRVGDRVLVEATVRETRPAAADPIDEDGCIRLSLCSGEDNGGRNGDGATWAHPSLIHSVFLRPLAVGDPVWLADMRPSDRDTGKICVVEGDEACVRWDLTGLAVYRLAKLERAQ